MGNANVSNEGHKLIEPKNNVNQDGQRAIEVDDTTKDTLEVDQSTRIITQMSNDMKAIYALWEKAKATAVVRNKKEEDLVRKNILFAAYITDIIIGRSSKEIKNILSIAVQITISNLEQAGIVAKDSYVLAKMYLSIMSFVALRGFTSMSGSDAVEFIDSVRNALHLAFKFEEQDTQSATSYLDKYKEFTAQRL